MYFTTRIPIRCNVYAILLLSLLYELPVTAFHLFAGMMSGEATKVFTQSLDVLCDENALFGNRILNSVKEKCRVRTYYVTTCAIDQL